jgi:NAD(P)-dependent dehydrogenase (short-subunit alcohol dehydrogenase family)
MHDKPVALVTGANKGIGLQIAKDLPAHGLTVLVGSRKLQDEKTAAKSVGADARALQFDVTNQASVAAAAERIRREDRPSRCAREQRGHLVCGKAWQAARGNREVGRLSVASRAVVEANVFGVIAVTQAMLPLLREAPAARIVKVSRSTGSLTLNSDPADPRRAIFGTYSSSKTALNALTLDFALDLESTGIKVNAACPGFAATTLNDFEGTRTVEQAAREPVRLALFGPDGPTGTYSDENGPLP